jgi:hypothetical protein
VPVDTRDRVLMASGVRDIENKTPLRLIGPAHLARHGHRVKGGDADDCVTSWIY